MAAKKSNKTEHVLKLITKDQETIEALTEKEEREEAAADRQSRSSGPEVHDEKPQAGPEAADEGARPSASAPEPERDPEAREEAPPPREPVRIPAAGVPGDEYLINIAELMVRENVDMVMRKLNVCPCRSCYNNVLALALNSLPTKYVTTNKGRQYFQLDAYRNHYETDVLAALTKACVRVKAAPRHGEK